MTLENIISSLNTSIFWREFTFSQTKFYPRPKEEVELADGIVRIGSLTYIFQLKERLDASINHNEERKWFHNKVLKKAYQQIKSSYKYLSELDNIELTNEQGHTFFFSNNKIKEIKKIIIYRSEKSLPDDCSNHRFKISKEAGFIHVISATDYYHILKYIIVPDDIRRYFDYREHVLNQIINDKTNLGEMDILGAYLHDDPFPNQRSKELLHQFYQNTDDFDLSSIMHNLVRHIQHSRGNNSVSDYYNILEEFALIPRSAWCAFKERLVRSIDATKSQTYCQPFRFTYPGSDCTFMIASMDPLHCSVGDAGERLRINGLQLLTTAAKYAQKSTKTVGLLISKDGDHFQLDWCFVKYKWTEEDFYENLLKDNNPFRPVKEQNINSFYFVK